MKTLDRYLCAECAQMLRDAQLVFKKIPSTQGDKPECDWCHKRRYGSQYKIKYGRKW